MAYTSNILPRSAAYYTLSNAEISGTDLVLSSGGYAEIQVSAQMLPKLTPHMLVVVHPSVFSDPYTNSMVQVNISILTVSGARIEYLIPVTPDKSGVFNTELELPEEEYAIFTYRVSSKSPVTIYNWELCSEEAADLTTVIDGVEQSLPKLLYDYNTYSFAVGQNETTVGLISCYLLSATDLQGHFTLSFFATERCNVYARIKDNNVTELFSPQVFTVEKGYSSISVPHAYLRKLATDHSFSVTLQCSNGQLSIPVRGLLYTIDGGYLATRLLDAGVDIEDISIKQTISDAKPSEIWAIGFESNRLVLKRREYSLLQRVNWAAVKDFGGGKCAAIEFHGEWANRGNVGRYTIETEAQPFVFIVDLQGTLTAYSGSSFENAYQMDTGVSAVAACLGFCSMYDVNQRQGLIVAYIKNGSVYYRQYLYDSASASFRWFAAEPLYEEGDASFISIHRLPDYRVGICVTHTSGTKWFITDRTYVSQTVKPELINCSINGTVSLGVFDADRVPDTVVWPGTPNVYEAAVNYNDFTVTYDGQPVLLDGETVESLAKTTVVTVNDSVLATDAYTISLNDDSVVVTLATAVRPTNKISINFNNRRLCLKVYNGSIVQLQQSFSWSLPAFDIKHTHTERMTLGLTSTSVTVDVIPIVTNKFSPVEPIDIDVSPAINLTMYEVVTQKPNNREQVDLSVSDALTLSVVQTGETPL